MHVLQPADPRRQPLPWHRPKPSDEDLSAPETVVVYESKRIPEPAAAGRNVEAFASGPGYAPAFFLSGSPEVVAMQCLRAVDPSQGIYVENLRNNYAMRTKLRIGTWNIGSNRNYDAIISRISELDVDVCAMQEVWLDCATDLPALANRRGRGGYCWYFTPALSPYELDRHKSEYDGLAILSREPLRWIASFQLGPGSLDRELTSESEPRIVQVAASPLKRPILVGNTHLAATGDWTPSSIRQSQASRLSDILRAVAGQGDVVLCGDFNTGPSSSDLEELRNVLPHGYASTRGTYVGEPERPPIDFFRSSTELALEVLVFAAKGLSDHDIAVATLQLDDATSNFLIAEEQKSAVIEPRREFLVGGDQCVGIGGKSCVCGGSRQHAERCRSRPVGRQQIKNRVANHDHVSSDDANRARKRQDRPRFGFGAKAEITSYDAIEKLVDAEFMRVKACSALGIVGNHTQPIFASGDFSQHNFGIADCDQMQCGRLAEKPVNLRKELWTRMTPKRFRPQDAANVRGLADER